MRYAYYAKLKPRQQAVYRRSDRVAELKLHDRAPLHPLVAALEDALAREDRAAIERAARKLTTTLLAGLGLPPIGVKVLTVRPSRHWGELHGLYEPAEGRRRAAITVWMRTAQRKKVVAFKTFLRTVLHEVCHHLDYELLKLEDSFHTEGFFKRESSLLHQLLAPPA